MRPGTAAGGDAGSGGGGNGGDSLLSGHGVPYATPVLMILFDNGSVQCYTSPAHLTAIEKQRTQAVADRATITDPISSARQTTAERPSLLLPFSPPARASVNGEGWEEADWRGQSGAGIPQSRKWKSKPTRAAVAAAATSAATTSLLNAAGRMSLRTRASAPSSLLSGPRSSTGAPSADTASNRQKRTEVVAADAAVATTAKENGAAVPRASSIHRSSSRPRLWQQPPSLTSSLTSLEDALAARRAGRRAADRAQRIAWASHLTDDASGWGRDEGGDWQLPSSALQGRVGSSGRGVGAVVATRREDGAAGDSSGHETTSDDEAFISFRSQVGAGGNIYFVRWALRGSILNNRMMRIPLIQGGINVSASCSLCFTINRKKESKAPLRSLNYFYKDAPFELKNCYFVTIKLTALLFFRFTIFGFCTADF